MWAIDPNNWSQLSGLWCNYTRWRKKDSSGKKAIASGKEEVVGVAGEFFKLSGLSTCNSPSIEVLPSMWCQIPNSQQEQIFTLWNSEERMYCLICAASICNCSFSEKVNLIRYFRKNKNLSIRKLNILVTVAEWKIQISFLNKDLQLVSYNVEDPNEISETSKHFIWGVLQYLKNILAFLATS